MREKNEHPNAHAVGNATNKLFTGFIRNKSFPKINRFSLNFPEILRLKVNYQLDYKKNLRLNNYLEGELL